MGLPDRSRKRLASLLPAALALSVIASLWAIAFHAPVYSTGIVVSQEPKIHWAKVVASSAGARRSGIVPGSEIDLASLTTAQRMRWRWGAQRGHVFTIAVRSGGATRMAQVAATEPVALARSGWLEWTTLVMQSIAVLLVGYLAFLRPSLMTFALLVYECGTINIVAAGRSISNLPDWAFTPLALALVAFFGAFPSAALASFAARFPHERVSGWRLRFARVVDAVVVFAFFAGLAFALIGVGVTLAPYLLSAYALLVLVVSIVSLAKADRIERGRIAVVFAGTICSSVAYNALVVYWLANGQHASSIVYLALAFAPAILPLAVTYGVLRHRIFDIAFIVNRAVVYGLTSAILVVIIEALEFIAERFVSAETHVESALTEFAITLAVVVCIRPIHRRVDSAVDNLFFRARHEQESALLRFAKTAQFYTETTPLVRDAVDAIVRFGKVHGAAIFLTVPDGASCAVSTFSTSAPFIQENDTALVELRAHGEVLDAHTQSTAFPGVRLYPMMLAGRLDGVLAVGERESGEEMPPDIDAAIRAVASSIGMTLESIETARLRGENAALRRGLQTAPT